MRSCLSFASELTRRRQFSVKRFGRDEQGGLTIFMLFMILVLVVLSGIAVDYSNAERTRSQLQAAADAAAIAAVTRISDPQEARNKAIEFASLNAPAAIHGQVLVADDVEFGQWDADARAFVPAAAPADAVRVTTRRADVNDNALPTYLLRLTGLMNSGEGTEAFNISAQAVMATSFIPGTAKCDGSGLFSYRKIESGSNNSYRDGFCLYGRRGVKIGSDNSFEDETSIEMPNLSDFEQSGNNSNVNQALRQGTQDIDFPNRVQGIINDMRSGDLSRAGLPSYITQVVTVSGDMDDDYNLQPGTLYIVNGDVDLGSKGPSPISPLWHAKKSKPGPM